jgi:hypothetical protein
MAEAKRLPPTALMGQDFNAFLFAAIGPDQKGGQLSVVSALARLDLDPWAEAATLARLPGDMAVKKLSAVIERFPEITSGYEERGRIAKRLVALLPRPGLAQASKALPFPRTRNFAASPRLTTALLVILAVILASAIFMHHHHQASPPAPAPAAAQNSKT